MKIVQYETEEQVRAYVIIDGLVSWAYDSNYNGVKNHGDSETNGSSFDYDVDSPPQIEGQEDHFTISIANTTDEKQEFDFILEYRQNLKNLKARWHIHRTLEGGQSWSISDTSLFSNQA